MNAAIPLLPICASTARRGTTLSFTFLMPNIFQYNYESKVVPFQAWSGPEGSRKLTFPDFMTTAQDGGKFVILTHRPSLPPRNASGAHFC